VCVADLFATVAELAVVDLGATLPQSTLDSVSVVPYLTCPALPSLRGSMFAEYFSPNGTHPVQHQVAIRDYRFKVIRTLVGDPEPYGDPELFFDLLADPHETCDLLDAGTLGAEEQAHHDALDQELTQLLAGY